MVAFTIRNNNTNRSYIVYGSKTTSINMVWLSQKCVFSNGYNVTITDENGNEKTFAKVG